MSQYQSGRCSFNHDSHRNAKRDLPRVQSRSRALILEQVKPTSLFAFSHRYFTIHVPKEHEHLYRLLEFTPEEKHIDFLNRFIEYLAWSSKFVNDQVCSYPRGSEPVNDPEQMYLSALENHARAKEDPDEEKRQHLQPSRKLQHTSCCMRLRGNTKSRSQIRLRCPRTCKPSFRMEEVQLHRGIEHRPERRNMGGHRHLRSMGDIPDVLRGRHRDTSSMNENYSNCSIAPSARSNILRQV